jgi:hypothetical protein
MILVFARGRDISIAIRPGVRWAHDSKLEDGASGPLFYRPEKFDVAMYSPHRDELAINAETKGEQMLYKEKLGLHFFGSKDYFPGDGKYSLEPLRRDGPRALFCGDVDGMDWVRLHELMQSWQPWSDETVTRCADDVFHRLGQRNKGINPLARLTRATFLIKLRGAERARTVTIRPSNVADFARDGASGMIELGLARRECAREEVAA